MEQKEKFISHGIQLFLNHKVKSVLKKEEDVLYNEGEYSTVLYLKSK